MPDLLPLIFNLVLVVAMIIALAWFVRRGQRLSQIGAGQLDVIATRMIGQRERLVVVRVGDEQLLLGVTAQQVQHLHTLREPLPEPSDETSFSGHMQSLKKSLKRERTAS
ncbi:MAG: flagellar biosynthetic protein FliO [Pseudomonadota bacterium]